MRSLVAALGISSPVFADVHPTGMVVVTNCDDDGAGSLRAAVQDDISGDPIDLTQLACSQITLSSGAVQTSRSLTLLGPGSGILTIDGSNNDRVVGESGAGTTLAIYGLTLQHGHVTSASGGCIYSAGSVTLGDVIVTGCSISGAGAGTDTVFRGGGLYVKDDLTATDSRILDNTIDVTSAIAVGGGIFIAHYASIVGSTISHNTVRTAVEGGSYGGGIWVNLALTMDYSTVSGNVAESNFSAVGGVKAAGFRVDHSTISGNTAERVGGLIADNGSFGSYLSNSTVSGNTARRSSGVDARFIFVYNSTIAFNIETEAYECAGLCVESGAIVFSSIIAANSSDGMSQGNVGGSAIVEGSNNLIGESRDVNLPPDTIQSDPLLAPLADNGGPTLTHALLAGSPAIDTGNNVTQAEWDQRGEGFARVIGPTSDIGAFEAPSQNHAPAAMDDEYTILENTTLTVSAPGLLANDFDADEDMLTALLVDDVSNGSLTLDLDGGLLYEPEPGFSGTDSFTYEASDGLASSNVATVTIVVQQQVDEDLVFVNGFEQQR